MNDIIYVDETTSTNTLLKNKLSADGDLPEFTMLYTGFQTLGRGQKGNSWESERNKNIMCSILLKPVFLEAKEQFVLSEAVSLAILNFLDYYLPNIKVKWPNDIYYGDKKISGILIENTIQSNSILASIVGIGINVNQTIFMSDALNPVSLSQVTGQDYDIPKLINEVRDSIIKCYDFTKSMDEAETMHKYYLSKLYKYNEIATYKDEYGTFKGKIIDVELHGGKICIEDEDGKIRKYNFKEVSFII